MTDLRPAVDAPSPSSDGATERAHPGLGTVLAALCVTEIVSWGLLYYTFPVLAPLIGADTGWSSLKITAAFSAALVVSALAGVPVGHFIDRQGPRRVMTAGSVLGALALVVVATAPNLVTFFAGWLLVGLAMSGVLYPPAFAAITRWFSTRRMGALATLTLVAGLASTVFAPIAAAVAEQWGWRQTYVAAAVVLAVLTIPTHAVLLRRPWPTEPTDSAGDLDSTAKLDRAGERVSERSYAVRVLRSGQFWLLAIGLTAVSLAMYASLLALVPLMLERGMAAQGAAWVLGLGGVGQVLGRLGYTAVAQRVPLVGRTALTFGLVTISIIILAVVPGPTAVLVGASMVAGVGRGIATLLQATAVTDRWGARAYGHLSGVLGLPVLLASAFAAWAGAGLAQLTGSYATAFLVLAVVAAMGTAFLIASTRQPSVIRPSGASDC